MEQQIYEINLDQLLNGYIGWHCVKKQIVAYKKIQVESKDKTIMLTGVFLIPPGAIVVRTRLDIRLRVSKAMLHSFLWQFDTTMEPPYKYYNSFNIYGEKMCRIVYKLDEEIVPPNFDSSIYKAYDNDLYGIHMYLNPNDA